MDDDQLSKWPWEPQYDNDTGPEDDYFIEFWTIYDADDNPIGRFDNWKDAALAAAAQELLATLTLLYESLMSGYSFDKHLSKDSEVFNVVREVLAKAKGA